MIPPPNAIVGKLPGIPPVPAAEAASTFRVLDGFRMELLAAEPLVASPVAITYDENGRAYVCEMRDYPYTDKARHQRNQENPTDAPIGTVRLLDDINGDGVFDKATVFADGLSWPTGVACWKGGVFVAATPDIWYFKDTDGDGTADIRRKVFTGFRKLNVQSVMNNLVWGPDNRIYGAGGSNGGQIRPGENPDAKPIVMRRNDFRFDPITGRFEPLSGGARFGGTFDDWGHRFLCDIRNPAQHIVLPEHYLARNPFLAARSSLHDMAESGDQLPVYRISPPELWREIRAKRWAGERDIVMPRSELVGAGVVTSSSGITVYRGAAYPPKYRGNVFVCEVAGNLFYRLQLAPNGPTFNATRVDGQAEMAASTDNWFRPVNFVNAPDGTLHVVDMYRENIEHPWSIPDDIHAAVDLESGRERGRLWRLAPPNFKPQKPPRLGNASTPELVDTLQNPNSWWRETAQRLLFERQDPSAVPALRQLATHGQTSVTRLHALWALAGLDGLTDEDLLSALKDDAAGVRENAIKLAEAHVLQVNATERARVASPLIDSLLTLAADPDAFVRFQLAFTLGELEDARAADALAAIAKRDAGNPWSRTAILSSVADTGEPLLTRLIADASFISDISSPEFLHELAQFIGARGDTSEMQRVLSSAGNARDNSTAPLIQEIVSGFGEGLKRSGKSLRRPDWNTGTRQTIDRLLANSARTAADSQAALDARLAAIRLLTFDDFDRINSTLATLLPPSHPQEIQVAAVNAIGSFSDAETAELLLSNWTASSPAVRSEIVIAMLSGRNRLLPLLNAINNRLIPANQVPFPRRAMLLRNADPNVKELAAKFFGDSARASRNEIVAKYQAALSIKGNPARGRTVFETACATCHQKGDLGKDVGPNLAAILQWNPEQILINILDPNREVAPNFLSYTIETNDGRTLDGIITAETAASITLKRPEAVTETVLRRDIAQISGSGLSLMPEELESAISLEQMADLISFLTRSGQ